MEERFVRQYKVHMVVCAQLWNQHPKTHLADLDGISYGEQNRSFGDYSSMVHGGDVKPQNIKPINYGEGLFMDSEKTEEDQDIDYSEEHIYDTDEESEFLEGYIIEKEIKGVHNEIPKHKRPVGECSK